MQQVNHQMMGYDRAITMFSPDGRLLQVEYAKKTVKQGSTAIGVVCQDGVVLVTDKRIVDPLVVADSVQKIFQIDNHMAATAAGILSDARVLIERAQVKGQQYKVTYDSPVDTVTVVKELCDLKQICTQSGGLRPFGVSLLVAGIDVDGPHLFETDPTGIFFEYKATAIGQGEAEASEILHKEYKENMSVEQGTKFAIKILHKVLKEKFNIERVDCVFIKNPQKQFTRMTKQKISQVFNEIKKGR